MQRYFIPGLNCSYVRARIYIVSRVIDDEWMIIDFRRK